MRMTSALDRIIEGITEQADAKAAGILGEAGAEAKRIRERCEAERATLEGRLRERLALDRREIEKRAESRNRQARRRAFLETRSKAIDEAISEAKEKLYSLPARDYFDILLRMYEKNSLPRDGVMYLSPADHDRAPEDFAARCAKVHPGNVLRIERGAGTGDRGFIIEYGDIVQNCLLDVFFREEASMLRDKAYEAFAVEA